MSWTRIAKYMLTRLAFATVVPAVPQTMPRQAPPIEPPVARHCITARQPGESRTAAGVGATH